MNTTIKQEIVGIAPTQHRAEAVADTYRENPRYLDVEVRKNNGRWFVVARLNPLYDPEPAA